MNDRGRDRVRGARVIRLRARTNSDAPAGEAGAAARARLGHFPRLEDHDHPARWAVPSWMRVAGSASPWLASLCELYDHPIAFPASLSPDAGWLLHGIVRNHRPRVAIEVGTFVSVSTHWIAGALAEQAPRGARTSDAEPVLHCFDDFGPVHKGPWRDAEMLDGRIGFVRAQLERAALSRWTRLHPGLSGPTIGAMRKELARAGGVDLAFIDGDHSTPGVLADFRAAEPVLNTGALVILHDTFPEQCGGHEGGRALLDRVHEFATGRYEKMDLYLQPLNYGLGVLRRIG